MKKLFYFDMKRIKATIVLLLFGAICFVAGTFRGDYALDHLVLENERLSGQLASLELQTRELADDLDRLTRDDQALRLSSGLTPFPEDVYDLGVGGRSESHRFGVDGPLDVWTRLDRIASGVRLLDASFNEVEERMRHNAETLSRIPSICPVPHGVVNSRFGMRMHPIYGVRAMHEGLDFAAKEGTPVVAAADGVVTFNGSYGGYGRMVELNHGNGFVTRYAHNLVNKVRVGQRVARGQVVALVGASGLSTSTHLHYEVRQKGVATDPLPYVFPGVVVD
jgi:murein DD-endopeptidase MepM/ murein hydrolase activator NlpD